MKYDSVIFDLDGTLLDTLCDLKNSVNFALRSHGMAERSLGEVRRFVGNGIRNLCKRAAQEGTSEEKVDEILATFRSHYKDHSNDNTKPYDGITELLSSLKSKGIPTAIVSNKVDSAVQTLTEEYFNRLIDVAVGELEGVARKPEPDTVFLAMKKLGCSHPVYVGDSEVDVETAKNAGLDGIFVTWGFRDEEELRAAGADTLVSSVKELWEALQ